MKCSRLCEPRRIDACAEHIATRIKDGKAKHGAGVRQGDAAPAPTEVFSHHDYPHAALVKVKSQAGHVDLAGRTLVIWIEKGSALVQNLMGRAAWILMV